MKKSALADLLWETTVNAYNQGGRTRVTLPIHDVIDVLLSLTANVISQIPDARERTRIVNEMAPQVDRIVSRVRNRPDFYLPSRPKLVI